MVFVLKQALILYAYLFRFHEGLNEASEPVPEQGALPAFSGDQSYCHGQISVGHHLGLVHNT